MMSSIRRVEPADGELLWQWRNDPVVRSHSLNSKVIPWAHHERWFAGKLVSPDTRIFILEDRGRPIAQVRYERRDKTAEVGDISVAKSERGRGYGTQILKQTLQKACEELQVQKIVAVVRDSNIVSIRIFVGAGFQLEGELSRCGEECKSLTYIHLVRQAGLPA